MRNKKKKWKSKKNFFIKNSKKSFFFSHRKTSSSGGLGSTLFSTTIARFALASLRSTYSDENLFLACCLSYLIFFKRATQTKTKNNKIAREKKTEIKKKKQNNLKTGDAKPKNKTKALESKYTHHIYKWREQGEKSVLPRFF